MAGLVLQTPGPGEQTMYRHQGTQDISLGSMASQFDAEAEEEAELGRAANGRKVERALREVAPREWNVIVLLCWDATTAKDILADADRDLSCSEALPTPTRADSLPSRRLRQQSSKSSLRSETSDRPSSRAATAAARERARLQQVQRGYDVEDDSPARVFASAGPSNFVQIGEGTMDGEETKSIMNAQVDLTSDTPARPASGMGERERNGRERGGGVKELLKPKSLKDQDAELKKLHDDHWKLQIAFDNLRQMLDRYEDQNTHKMMEDLLELRNRLSESEKDRAVQRKANKQLNKTLEDKLQIENDLLAQIRKLKKALKEALAKQGTGGNNEEEVEKLRDNVQLLEEDKEDLQAEIAKYQDELDRVQDELEDLKDGESGADRLQARLHQAEADNESLEKEIEKNKARIVARDEERQEHLSRIQRFEEDIRVLKTRLEDRETMANRTVAHAEGIAEEADKIDAERLAALEALDQSRREIATLQETIDELDDRDRQAADKIQELESDLAMTNGELEDLAGKNLALEQEVDALKEEKVAYGKELQKADDELRELDEKERLLRQSLAQLEADCDKAAHERDVSRREQEKLLKEIEDFEGVRRDHNEVKREKADLESELRREKTRRQQDAITFKKESESEADRWRRIIADKEESNLRLSSDIETTRDRLAEAEQSVKELQLLLEELEDDRRKTGDDHTSDRFGLDMENQRLKRELEGREKEILRLEATIKRMEDQLADKEMEIDELLGDKRDLDNALATERSDRSILSDRLQRAERLTRQSETDANNLRSRLDDLQRRLSEDQRSISSSQRQTDGVRREAHELLTTVYLRVAKLSGSDEVDAPSTIPGMKDKLLSRIKALGQAAVDFERKLKAVETKVDLRFQGLNRELESKKRLLNDVETALSKVTAAKLSWKTKLTLKEDELADAKARLRDLQAQISSLRSNSPHENQSESRSLNLRAQNAEKRVSTLTNQLAALQGQIADQESKHSDATSKWEARVAEFEKRLKAANEKVKAERQGGKETQLRLENTIKDYKEQIKTTNARSDRLQSVLSAAKMGTKDPDAL